MELILSRHGETLENQQHILQGQLPGTLSPLGIAQAEKLADMLQNETIDNIVSSDLSRSYNTALAVAKRHGITPHQTPLLREMDWGIYTGKRLDDVDWNNLPPSVESLEALFQRATDFINYLKKNFPGQRVLAIGHGAFNRAIITYLNGKKATDMTKLPIMENTSCLYFTLTDNDPTIQPN